MEHRDRSIAAQQRAVEEGHRALLASDKDGPYVKVVSDTTHDKHYKVRSHRIGDVVRFTCTPSDWGQPGRARDHGVVVCMVSEGDRPCKHVAVAARRLEREGLLRWVDPHVHDGIAFAGRWVPATPAAPVVLDEEAGAASSSRPIEALAEVASWRTVPAIVAHGMGIVTPWTERITHASPAEYGRTPVRRASDSQGYRSTVSRLDPETAQAFASFGQADQR